MNQRADKKQKNIRTQMIRSIGMFVVLPLCVGLLLLNTYLQKFVEQNKETYAASVVTQIQENADKCIETANYITSSMLSNHKLLKNIRTMEATGDPYEKYIGRMEISDWILDIQSSVLNAAGGKMLVLTSDGYLIGSYSRSKTEVVYESRLWYQNIIKNGRKATFSPYSSAFFEELDMVEGKSEENLYICRTIKDYAGRHLGLVMIQISGKKIWGNYLELMKAHGKDSVYIYDRRQKIMSSYNKKDSTFTKQLGDRIRRWEKRGENQKKVIAEGENYYLPAEFRASELLLVYTVPKSVFLEERGDVAGIILIISLVLIFLSVCIVFRLSGRISQPLISVVDAIDQSKDGLTHIEEPSEHTYVEIHKLVAVYNQAGEKIKLLLNRVEEESRMKEKTKYEMLQSQISPHFIFNTVNSIRIMVGNGKDPKTERALESLGEILHAVYASKDGMTTVGQESGLLQSYVDIMKMRFGDTFMYLNCIPTELYFYEIPTFTMQPLVENAILHGVRDQNAGQIIVSGVEYEHDFIITVFNNGNVSAENIEEIISTPRKNRREVTGIGLYNVNSRLKMLYGDSYGLIYNDRQKSGFEIWIRIPKRADRK